MKRLLAFIFPVLLVMLLVTACEPADTVTASAPPADAGTITNYSDPDIDMHLQISDPGWSYYKEEDWGIVFFYPKEHLNDGASFSVSSEVVALEKDAPEQKVAETVAGLSEKDQGEFAVVASGLQWSQADPIAAGEFQAYRYHFTGTETSKNRSVTGDYIYWWTGARLYTCLVSAPSGLYESTFSSAVKALGTFRIQSLMK